MSSACPSMTPSASFQLTFTRDFLGRLGLRRASEPALSVEQQETLDLALSAYGYLLARNEQISGQEMARRIEASYAPGPQRDAVLEVVRLCEPELDGQSESAPGELPAGA